MKTIYTILLLLFISSNLLAGKESDVLNSEFKLAVELSGNKLQVSSLKLKKSREKLKVLVIVLNEKKKKREISDDEYDRKIEIIKGYEKECNEVEKDIVELDAVIKIKHKELAKIEIKINATKEEVGNKEKEHDRGHKHPHKHNHKKHNECKHDECEHHHHHHDKHQHHDHKHHDDNNEQ